jgi:hypothetical protein
MAGARIFRFTLIVGGAICGPGAALLAQLDPAIAAQGGLAKWQSYGGVEFDLKWSSAKGVKQDYQLFDLHSREGLITGANYSLGASKGEVWIKPDAKALGGTPPRFYMWTPFYFFGMPFVFADPGALQQPLGKKMFQGHEYDATKVTFNKGTGDTSDDFYVAYVDPASGQLKLVSYVVTYPLMRKGKPIEELEQHAIVFQEWQQAGGLKVPKTAPFYAWKNENIEGEPLATLAFSNVHFSEQAPDRSKFARPENAVIAPLD